MDFKHCLVLGATFALTGCAVLFPPIDTAAVASNAPTPTAMATLASGTPVTEVDITQFTNQGVRCEPLTRTGTRIVVAKRCAPAGANGVDEERLAEQMDIVRRDQEELDRRRREVQERRGPGLY